MFSLLFISDVIVAESAFHRSAYRRFVILSMSFNISQRFTDERTIGTRILLFIRMHHVTC